MPTRPSPLSRAQGCLAGLAIGDALGRPAEGMSPAEIAARWGRIDGYVEETPEGSDDTEYAMLTATALLRFRGDFTAANIAQLWEREVCGQPGSFKGAGFSEMAAVQNLARGLKPPRSGQHSHAWSDGLAMRIAPVGIVCAGDPSKAASYALEDGLVSHSEEGIWAGQAVAAAVAVAMTGAPEREIFKAALEVIPASCWTAALLERARQIVQTSTDWADIAEEAGRQLLVHDYYWFDLAPEAVALAFTAVLAGKNDFRETVLNAVNLGRDADTIAAIAGGIAGAAAGIEAVPHEWLQGVTRVPGVCLRVTEGMHPLEVAEQLVELIPAGALND